MSLFYNTDRIEVHLSSAHADASYGACSYEWYLETLEVPPKHFLTLGVVDAIIPRSWYDVNQHNCVLNYVQYDDYDAVVSDNLIYLQQGNYDAHSLMTYLQPLLSNITISYSEITNKYTFVNSTYNFRFDDQYSTCLDLLGFSRDNSYTSSYLLTKVLSSNKAINLNFTNCICVRSNQVTRNVQTYNGCNNMLCSIPVSAQSNDVILYKAPREYQMNTFQTSLDDVAISLTDMNGRELNLNGLHFTITLQIQALRFR